ncbi:cytochrome P450 family protein [Streptomyces eurythermus]|uniref:cytochrome P450 family protein n=1 Tax=Streptomyces eurythermus TaxID=42237 RepID=UPI0033D8CB9A
MQDMQGVQPEQPVSNTRRTQLEQSERRTEAAQEMEDSELGRRLQMLRGMQWVFGANGDPYARLLCGMEDDPSPFYDAIRTLGELHRSRTGAWVTADPGLGGRILADRRLGARRLVAGAGETDGLEQYVLPGHQAFLRLEREEAERLREVAAPVLGAAAVDAWRPLIDEVCAGLAKGLPDTFDLVEEYAGLVPVEVLARIWGVPEEDRARFGRDCRALAPALDSLLCPQQLALSKDMASALEDLRLLFDGLDATPRLAGPADGDGTAVAMLTVLLCTEPVTTAIGNTVLGLLPGQWPVPCTGRVAAGQVAGQALHRAVSYRIATRFAREDLELAGCEVKSGDEVVVLAGAIGRNGPSAAAPPAPPSPAAPPAPSVFGAAAFENALAEPLVRAVTGAALHALAERAPRLTAAGPVVRRRRSPVVGGLHRAPVAAA